MRDFHRGLAAILAVWALADPGLAADLHVPATHATVAAALSAAAPGDRVIIAPGVHHASDLDLPAGVTLLGDPSSPASVIIDAAGAGRILRAESLTSPVALVGLTLTGGHAKGEDAYAASGGALFVNRAKVRLDHCRLVDNRAEASGGGLRVAHGEVVLVACVLSGNTAAGGGGAMDVSYDAAATAVASTFDANTALWGGGVSVRTSSHLTLDQCRLQGNEATDSPGLGGAVAADRGAEVVLKRSVVARNLARYGGGVYTATDATTLLTLATLDRNEAEQIGGGVYGRDASVDLDRSIISFNEGTAITTLGDQIPSVRASDLHGNSGGDWTGPLAGKEGIDGNLDVDPLYCGLHDHHLQAASPCAPEHNRHGQVGALDVGCVVPTAAPATPGELSARAQPNPFNPRTEITYSLPGNGMARLRVVDLRGRRLATLVDAFQPAGDHRVSWDGRSDDGRALPSGTYVLDLEADGRHATTKLMLLR